MDSKYTLKDLQGWVRFLYGSGAIEQDSDIADAMKVHKSSVSNAISGRVRFSDKFIEKFLMAFPQVLKQSIKKDDESQSSNKKEDNTFASPRKDQAVNVSGSSIMLVPLVAQHSFASYLRGFMQENFVEELPKVPFIVPEGKHRGVYRCFVNSGNSMDSGDPKTALLDGDKLLCRQVPQDLWRDKLHIVKWNRFVIVHKYEGIVTKNIESHDKESGELVLASFNSEYESFTVNLKDVLEIYNVVAIQRG